jgi:aminoglycoside phosphotransferase family enzyme
VDLRTALSLPDAYPHRPDRVDVIETHISWVFLADDRVYKVKKPVSFGFLDYSTQELRRHYSEEEVRLNAELAPGIYLRVAPVAGDPPRIDGDGEPVAHAVEMVRLPEHRMLDRLATEGAIPDDGLEALVDRLARFHAAARTGEGVDRCGDPDRVLAAMGRTLSLARGHIDDVVIDAVAAFEHGFVATHRAMLEARVADGRIREGHGDLHAANICLAEGGPVVYDRIEFSDSLRCCDVASDIAFLAMDLDRLGARAESAAVVERYAAATGDPTLHDALRFYRVHRAAVRGSVGFLRASQGGEGLAAALAYYLLALSYARPPLLILACGLQGTGKSTLARILRLPLRAVSLSSDETRKRLAGVPPTQRWTGDYLGGLYAPGMTASTYDALLDDAERHLGRGRSVVVDATFRAAAQRARFSDLARACGAELLVVHLDPPHDTIERRLRERAAAGTDVSDADVEVFRQTVRDFEPPDEIEPERRLSTAAEPESQEMLRSFLALVARLSQHN